jgi:hypothetical protein
MSLHFRRRLELYPPTVVSVDDSLRKSARYRLAPSTSFQIRGGPNAGSLPRDGQLLQRADSSLPALGLKVVHGAD